LPNSMEFRMYPVKKKPEPDNFDKTVRQRGMKFLKKTPNPSRKEWDTHAYWQQILPQMRKAYNNICAYCAIWISSAHGAESIDHFIPKSQNPELAYEWDNYRYSSLKFNRKKGKKTVLDPFEIRDNWFVMDFPSLFIHSNKKIADVPVKQKIENTINVFKFNEDEKFLEECQEYIKYYCIGDITFDYLERKAPFIAYELKRQGLIERIKGMMNFSKYPGEE